MKELTLRKWHRRLAIVVAPLLVLQALSGMILSIDWLLDIHQRFGETFPSDIPQMALLWDRIFVTIHYGVDVGGALYHVALGMVTVIVAISGLWIFLKIKQRQKKAGGR